MEPRRIYNHRSTHYQPHRSAASDPGYRSLRAFLLVKRQGAMDHLRKSRPHETHARERSRDRRERSHVPHSARPISLFRIGQSQVKGVSKTAIVVARGSRSRRNPMRFPPSSPKTAFTPVTLPPGRLKPMPDGTVARTIGIVVVIA